MKISENEPKRIIVIEKGNEYQPKLDDQVELKETFFYDVYRQAKFLMNELILRMETERVPQSRRTLRCAEKSEPLNNVIAFCAERGNGKTSALLSFIRGLRKETADYYDEKSCWISEKLSVLQHFYAVLESIDPTKMEASESILKVVISRLFNEFEEKERGDETSYREKVENTKRTLLLQQFQKCYHEVEILHDGKNATDWPLDELEQIAELGDSTNLRESMRVLVEQYLEYMYPGKEAYLILPIDDVDTNIGQTYQLLEDIRKYFFIPRLIILMAGNMRQMETTIEQEFLEQYQTGLKFADRGSMIDVDRCHEAAEFYLEKVIPGSRRIYLPSLKNAFTEGSTPVMIQYRDKDGNCFLPENCDYQEQLLQLLHHKTGLVFLTPHDYLNNFLPENFRELSHFLAYFSAMKNCGSFEQEIVAICRNAAPQEKEAEELKEKLQGWRQRFEKLEDYLIYIWAPSNLRQSARILFQNLTVQAWRNKNRYLMYHLPRFYEKEQHRNGELYGQASNDSEEFQEIYGEKSIYPETANESDALLEKHQKNGSYAQVVAALDAMTSSNGRENYYKICYAINLYYSICLHKLVLEDLEQFLKNQRLEVSKVSNFIQDISMFCVARSQIDLYGHLVREKFPLKREMYELRPFLRYLVVENDFQVMREINQREPDDKERDINQYTIIYDPSYILLSNADWITSGVKTNEPERLSTLALTMTILLNWDVQRNIRHQLKCLKEQRNVKDRESAYQICYGYVIRSVFEKIAEEQQDNIDWNGAIQLLVNKMNESKNEFLLFQMTGEFKESVTTAWSRCMNAVRNSLSSAQATKKPVTFGEWKLGKTQNREKQVRELEESLIGFGKYLPRRPNKKEVPDEYVALRQMLENIGNENLLDDLALKPMKTLCEALKSELQYYAEKFDIEAKKEKTASSGRKQTKTAKPQNRTNLGAAKESDGRNESQKQEK